MTCAVYPGGRSPNPMCSVIGSTRSRRDFGEELGGAVSCIFILRMATTTLLAKSTSQLVALRELRRILDIIRVRGLGGTSPTHLLLSPRSRAADIFTESFDRITTGKSENGHYQGKDEECFHDAIPILGITPCHLLFDEGFHATDATDAKRGAGVIWNSGTQKNKMGEKI